MSTLVYFCHFGDDPHADLLATAVTALRVVGNYQGDIFVYSDNGHRTTELVKKLPGCDKISVITNSGNRGLFTRYSAASYLSSLYGQYFDNFLYLDNDVIVKTDINPFIQELENSPSEIHCLTDEYFPLYNMKTSGEFKPLAIAYPRDHLGELLILNPAIFAFKPTTANSELFGRIRKVRDTTLEYRYNLGYDVALFSYEVFKRGRAVDRKLIDGLVDVTNRFKPLSTSIGEAAIFNIFSNYATAKDKLNAVRTYLSQTIARDNPAAYLIATLGK